MADYISVKDEFDADFDDLLYKRCWSGAIDTLKDIEAAGVEDQFMNYLNDVFLGETVDLGQLNDFIWFDRDSIYEACGLDENGEIIGLDSIKGNLDLTAYLIDDEGVDADTKYVDVWVSDTDIDFDIYITFRQSINGGEITSEVSDYSEMSDYSDLGQDAEVIQDATEIAQNYLEERGYIEDGNLVVAEE